MELFLFLVIGGLTFLAALMMVFSRSPLNSALYLILSFFFMAGLYLLLRAEFIAMIQLLVYAGAVMVLFLFVIMILNVEKEKKEEFLSHPARRIFGLALAVIIMPFIGLAVSTNLINGVGGSLWGAQGSYTPEVVAHINNTKSVASLLFTDYILPFEITSVLLLAAMVGVVYLAKREIKKP